MVELNKFNINEIINSPKIIGYIGIRDNCGAWVGSDDTRDVAYDVKNAMSMIKTPDKPFYLLLNDKEALNLEACNYRGVQLWKEVVIAFHPIASIMSIMDLCVVCKDLLIRKSNNVPDGIALLISENNNVVVIETG
jgi:hypothetical protein